MDDQSPNDDDAIQDLLNRLEAGRPLRAFGRLEDMLICFSLKFLFFPSKVFLGVSFFFEAFCLRFCWFLESFGGAKALPAFGCLQDFVKG